MAIELGVAYVSIVGETRKLRPSITKAMNAAAKPAAKAFSDGLDTSLGGVAKSFASAGKQGGKALAREALLGARADIQKISKSVRAATDANASAAGRLRTAQLKLTEVQADAGAKGSQLARAEEAVATAQRNVAKTAGPAKAATEKMAAAQAKVKAAAKSYAQTQTDVAKTSATAGAEAGNRFTRAFKRTFRPSTGGALDKLDGTKEGGKLGNRFGNAFRSRLGISAGVGGGLAAALGVTKLLKDSVGLEATFSQTMNTLAAVTNTPAAQIKTLSDLALKMGADTTFSASQAADAMLELAKGGMSAATIQAGGLEGTLKLAAAGGTDLATASTIASNAMSAFSLKGSDMESVAAALAGGANASTASVESLGVALSQVGPGATTAGLTLQDTVGVLAAFDTAGIKGSDAGTSLKTMLARLVPSTKKAAGVMKDLGLRFTDARGQFLPITDVAQQLQDKLGKLSPAMRSTALQTIFGSDATRAATVLMKQGAAGLATFITATKDQGAATKVAGARMSGTAGALESFKGSVETAKLQLGLFVAPYVQKGLKKLTDGINNMVPPIKALADLLIKGDFTGAFGKAFNVEEDSTLVSFILGVRDAVKTLAGFLTGTLIPAVSSVLGFFERHKTLSWELVTAVTALWAITKAHTAALEVQAALKLAGGLSEYIRKLAVVRTLTALWTGAQWLLNASFWAFPLTWIVLAIVALVVVIVLLWKKNEKFRKAVTAAWEGIKKAAVAVFGAIKKAVSAAIDFVRDHWMLILGIIGGPFVLITLLVVKFWGKIKAAFATAVSAVFGALRTAWGGLVGIVSGPLNATIGVITAIWRVVSTILALPINIARTLITAAFVQIANAFTAAKDWVIGVFAAGWNLIAHTLAGPIDWARTHIAWVWQMIQLAFTVAKDWVLNVFSKAWGAVSSTLMRPVNWARDQIASAWATIKSSFTRAKDWALNAFAKAWGAIQSKISGPIDAARNAVAGVLDKLKQTFSDAVSAVARIWEGLTNLVKKPIHFIIDSIINHGLIDSFNWLADKFHSPKLSYIPMPAGLEGLAGGGVIPGSPSRTDNMVALAPFGPMGVASGEMLVNSRQTAANRSQLEAINAGHGPVGSPSVNLTVNYPLPEKVSVALPRLLRSAASQLVAV